MGCAISTMQPAGQTSVTLDLKLTYLRPLSVRSGTISAEGKVVKLGRQTSYAEGFVRDGAGNLAVHATATFSMIGEREREIDAAFRAPQLLLYDCRHLMRRLDAVFERTQAGNPRADREEGLGAASRKGRAWHRRRRPDEGGGPDPWRLLRAFRFPRGAGDRGLRLCDGSLDRALAQALPTEIAAGEAARRRSSIPTSRRCIATIPAMAARFRRSAPRSPAKARRPARPLPAKLEQMIEMMADQIPDMCRARPRASRRWARWRP